MSESHLLPHPKRLRNIPLDAAELSDMLLAQTDGTAIDPAITFNNDPSSGWYLNDVGEIVYTSCGVDSIVQNKDYTEFKKAIMFSENPDPVEVKDAKGLLYKKLDSDGLWWRTASGEVNLASVTHVSENQDTQQNNESNQQNNESNQQNSESKLERFTAVPSNDITQLDFTFTTDSDTGMYRPAENVLGLVAGGTVGLVVSPEQSVVYNTLVVKDTEQSTPAIQDEGHLYKKANQSGLFWNTVSGTELDLTETRFPLVSAVEGSANAPVYGFSNTLGGSSGMYKTNAGGLGFAVGDEETLSLNTSHAAFAKPIEIKESTASGNSDTTVGRLYKKVGTNALVWNVAGVETELGSNSESKQAQDQESKQESNQNTPDTPTNINPTSSRLEFTAGEALLPGDIVGYDTDTSTNLVKSIGGHWQVISSTAGTSTPTAALTNSFCNARFAGAAGESVIMIASGESNTLDGASGTNIKCSIWWINDESGELIDSIEPFTAFSTTSGGLTEFHLSLVEISPNATELEPENVWYVLSGVAHNGNKIHLFKFGLDNVTHTYKPSASNSAADVTCGVAEAYDSAYDPVIDTLVCVAYVPGDFNFTAKLVKAFAGANTVLDIGGTIENSISTDLISDTNKQLHVASLPGQVIVISYGNRKVSFIAVAYDAAISQGETIIDYDSYDCVDMHFDRIENMLICVEKTITPSCFLQAIDVLGTKMQRIASKNFKNQTMEPFSISYNPTTLNYTLLFADATDSANMYAQIFSFDGDEFHVNMRYIASTNLYEEPYAFRKGKWIYALGNNKHVAFWPNGSSPSEVIAYFTDGYNSIPSAFVGMVISGAESVNDQITVMPRGTTVTTPSNMDVGFIGKKVYLSDPGASFPNNLSIVAINNSFVGTCLGLDKILLGL